MSSKTQLGFVSLQVSDLDASRRFYAEVLGFTLAAQSPPDACVFETQGGAVFALRTALVDLAAVSRLGWGVSLWFGVPDLEIYRAQLDGRAHVVRDVQVTPFGKILVVADPDGYWLTIQETGAR
jgi:catechol 2,3-dioxygenase-like lactoylglutathione lyase family enzyme